MSVIAFAIIMIMVIIFIAVFVAVLPLMLAFRLFVLFCWWVSMMLNFFTGG